MKKLVSMVFLTVLLFVLTACGGPYSTISDKISTPLPITDVYPEVSADEISRIYLLDTCTCGGLRQDVNRIDKEDVLSTQMKSVTVQTESSVMAQCKTEADYIELVKTELVKAFGSIDFTEYICSESTRETKYYRFEFVQYINGIRTSDRLLATVFLDDNEIKLIAPEKDYFPKNISYDIDFDRIHQVFDAYIRENIQETYSYNTFTPNNRTLIYVNNKLAYYLFLDMDVGENSHLSWVCVYMLE